MSLAHTGWAGWVKFDATTLIISTRTFPACVHRPKGHVCMRKTRTGSTGVFRVLPVLPVLP